MDTHQWISELTAERDRIDGVIKLLIGTLVEPPKAPTKSPSKVTETPAKKKGGMSAEGKLRVAAAQRKRWAKIKKAAKKGA